MNQVLVFPLYHKISVRDTFNGTLQRHQLTALSTGMDPGVTQSNVQPHPVLQIQLMNAGELQMKPPAKARIKLKARSQAHTHVSGTHRTNVMKM
jgi:hypothetical protein